MGFEFVNFVSFIMFSPKKCQEILEYFLLIKRYWKRLFGFSGLKLGNCFIIFVRNFTQMSLQAEQYLKKWSSASTELKPNFQTAEFSERAEF